MSDDFSPRTTPTYIDGIFMALVGVPDLWAVMDSPRCVAELLAENGMADHAWREQLQRPDGLDRLFTTDMLIDKSGTYEAGPLIRQLQSVADRGGQPGAVIVSEMTPSRLIGNDLQALSNQIRDELHVPCELVRFISLRRDFLDSFQASLVALAKSLPDSVFGPPSFDVAVVGYLSDRLEADHLANIGEMQRLIGALDLSCAPIWTSGSPYQELTRAASAKHIVALPYGRRAAKALAERSGAELLETGLPVGLEGTAEWLRQIGCHCGRESEAERAINQNLSECVPVIGSMVTRELDGARALVIADPALAAGLTRFFQEVGIECAATLYRCRRPGSISAVDSTQEVFGWPAYDPSVDSVTNVAKAALRDGPLNLIVGTSRERGLLTGFDAAFLELGFPSCFFRPIAEAPFLGFRGALHLVHRIVERFADRRFANAIAGKSTRHDDQKTERPS